MGNFICQLACVLATIFHTDSLQIATEEAKPDTLCLFDVDLVLIQPANPAFQVPTMKQYDYRRFTKDLTAEQKTELINLISITGPSTLVEADAPCIIRRLHAQGVPMAALTNTLTQRPYEADKIGRLYKLGITFKPLCDGVIIFEGLPSYEQTYPTYRAGMLFCNNSNKGEVLVDFLKKTELHYPKIIFIDDRMDNLKAVKEALEQYDPRIAFLGYLYTAGMTYPSQPITQEEFDHEWEKMISKVVDTNLSY